MLFYAGRLCFACTQAAKAELDAEDCIRSAGIVVAVTDDPAGRGGLDRATLRAAKSMSSRLAEWQGGSMSMLVVAQCTTPEQVQKAIRCLHVHGAEKVTQSTGGAGASAVLYRAGSLIFSVDLSKLDSVIVSDEEQTEVLGVSAGRARLYAIAHRASDVRRSTHSAAGKLVASLKAGKLVASLGELLCQDMNQLLEFVLSSALSAPKPRGRCRPALPRER